MLVSLFSLEQSSNGLNSLVSEALPVKEALANARLTLKDISTGAAEHYNARESQTMMSIRSRVESNIEAFNQMAVRLETEYPLLTVDPDLAERLTAAVTLAGQQFEAVVRNMNTHERSIDAEARIGEVRDEVSVLKEEAGPVFNRTLNEMTSADAKALAFRLQRLFDNASLLAINASLADSLELVESIQTQLRDTLDSVARLTFDIFDQVDADPAFAEYHEGIKPLLAQLGSLATSNDGLIAQQKNLYVEIRSTLPVKIEQVQITLAQAGSQLQEVSTKVDSAVVGISNNALEQVSVGRSIVIMATGLILFLCLVVTWVVIRSVRQPINRLNQYMKQVGNGDFSVGVGQYAHDEIGEIFQSTEQLVHNVRDMIVRIAELNREISTISTDSATATNAVRTRLNDQSHGLSLVATAITQMSASVREVAQNTREASDEVTQSEERAHDIEAAVDEAVGSSGQLTASMQSATDVIKTLHGEVAGIEQILDVIRNIAEQTNLLALNAAIEAARAGEQGRGFAVVADEVRTLASRTQTSTEEIRQKVDAVMAGSSDAVNSISTSVDNANEIASRVHSISETFHEYLTYIARVSQLNGQVSVATDQQQVVSEDITRRTQTISDSGADVAAEFETTAKRAAGLEKIASQLDQAIKRFQL
ncbi:methyl-accepting chemotaxis protein [Saccharospirillum impatiens]|uniref:methyl-accepting chemotaxis protein n=1 Tax=Saccharospirillum impatiens TaxID=169438 RepID=UPI00040E1AF7|nr:methyl-accepting chemotaxis protein [Saccharospirillum impatiens]